MLYCYRYKLKLKSISHKKLKILNNFLIDQLINNKNISYTKMNFFLLFLLGSKLLILGFS